MIHFQDHALLLNESHNYWFGERLVDEEDPGLVLTALNRAEQVVFSSGIEASPVFNYGNVKALALFGYELAEFTQLGQQEVVPEAMRALDQQLMAEVKRAGHVKLAASQRVSRSGKLWQIDAGVVWQLKDALGRDHGLGYCFTEYELATTLEAT